MLEINAQLIPKLRPLVAKENRFRYYVAHGGRGSGKSWSFARALLILAITRQIRVLCCREVMRTIADSVHRLLSDQVGEMGLTDFFTVQESSISCVSGSEFLFAGLRQQDAHKIKSFEGVNIAWVEEAQTLTQRSLDILLPTIRAENSEVWFTFNPELDTDPVYVQFVANKPENAFVEKVNYTVNPWFPKVLEDERVRMQRMDPLGYNNVWLGEPRTVVEGAIYAREVIQMVEEGRVRFVPYDPKLPVHTIWDLGWNDQTSVIFAQKVVSEVRLIDYDEASYVDFAGWAKRIRERPYLYASHWLPHDGGNKLQAAKGMSAQTLLTPLLGQRPKLMKRPVTKEDPIRAARLLFPRVFMDERKCGRLLECLKRYRRSIPETTGEPGKPVHDEYSHGADAFGGLAMVIEKMTNETQSRAPMIPAWGQAVQGVM